MVAHISRTAIAASQWSPRRRSVGFLGVFGLTAFERDLLLLCAGVEMDSSLAAQCAEAHGGQQRCALTFGLALASLAERHWSALTPAGPLRRFRLIHLDATHGLTVAPIRIDER